jgi:geranylgeranyl reductase family protein
MTETVTTDILIVRLGPAGARAAAEAAGPGHSVLAIDRKRSAGDPVQCAEFIPELLTQELANLDRVTRQRIGGMATFIEAGAPDIEPDFPGRMIDRRRFDAALVEGAEEAGADCRFGVQVEKLSAKGEVQLGDGRKVRAKLIIGADGPRSRIGCAIGRINHDLVETRQITVPLVRPHDATDIFLSAAIPGGYGWLFPKGEVANLGLGLAPWAKRSLKPLLGDLHANLVQEGRVGAEIHAHTGGLIPVGGMVDTYGHIHGIPVLLAGDAAGLANPVTGAGITQAVISGSMAGRAASDWLQGDDNALEVYTEELGDLLGPALARARRRREELLARYDSGKAPSPAALRRGWIAYPEYWAA